MAVLDATNRARVAAQFMRDNLTALAVTKAQFLAAVDATDDFIEAKQSEYNAALPTAARTNMTLVQKTLLFCYVAMRRALKLRTEEDG